MELIYIAAPYRAKTIFQLQHNISQARLMAEYYWLQGFAVLCPHLNSANMDGLCDDEVFLKGTLLMLSKCTHIALHPNWSAASGCIKEYEFALQNDIIIHFTQMDRVEKRLAQFLPVPKPNNDKLKELLYDSLK